MTSKKTHGVNHQENLCILETLIKSSSEVLCMDAFISNKTLDFFKNLNLSVDYFNYTKQLEARTAIQYSEKASLKNNLIEELKKGKKCFFFCSSRAKLTDYFLPAIRQAYPDKKIIE